MPKYLSGRAKRVPQDQLSEDRYQYLGLDQAEPNLSDPLVAPSAPTGAQYQLIAIPGFPGKRYWVPVGGGLVPGAITIFDENSPVSSSSSITQLNFVGAAVTANVSVQSPSGHPGIAATVTVIPVTVGDEPPNIPNPNNGELWWESDTGDLYVYYNDGDSSQWVMANAGGRGLTGDKGQKGEVGSTGLTGNPGNKGDKGQKGQTGDVEAQGNKGQKGEIGVGQKGQKGEAGVNGTDGNKGQKGEGGSKGQKGELGIGQKGEKGQKGTDGGGASVTISDNAPGSASAGDLWWDSDDFDLHVYYGDGDSNQWVSITSNAALKGQKGEKGEKGEKGQKGEKGDKGQKGEVGLTGNTGGDGDKGDKGDKGQKGQDGNDATGTKGQKGEKGEKGQEGAQGTGGDKGQKGEQNDKGQKGEPSTVKGQKGEEGPQGSGGSAGIKGQKGEKGEAGDKGVKGEVGTQGVKGEIGVGVKGQKGEDNSSKGQKGEEGPQGGGAPVGQIVAWSGSAGSLPSGYFLCDGSAVSRTTYAALYSIVGTTHGSGNGSSTFNLPDLRDRFILGASNSTGDSTYPGVSPSATGGSADATLVSHSHTINQHNHSFSGTTNNPGDHDHNVDTLNEWGSTHGTWQQGGGYRQAHAGGTHYKPITSDAGGHTHTVSGTTGGVSDRGTNSQGSSATNANLPPYYALAYIIQYAQGGTTAKGQKGEAGDKGQKGEQNDKGQKGEIGAGTKGQKGESGSKGQKGEDGTQGVGGTKGEKGQKGQGGSDGSDGDKGQKGEIGTQGTGGNPGAKGEKGQKGEQGAGGTDGSDGDKGQKGETGTQGTGGNPGAKGQKGEAGPVAGSANQVVYKNSSNVATGSNNLTFDGNILKLPSTTLSNDGDGTYTINGAHLQIGSNAADSLQFWHDSGSNLSGISEVGSGDLSIITNGTNLYIQKDATAGYAEDMIHCIANGAVKLFYDGGSTAKVETTSSGAKVNGNLEVTGTISPSGMIVNARTSGYSLVASDAGKLVTMTTGDCSVLQNVFSAGNAVTVYNNSNNAFSILQGSGVTMYLAGTTSSGNRTLRGRGMATIVCVASNTFSIAGSGLS